MAYSVTVCLSADAFLLRVLDGGRSPVLDEGRPNSLLGAYTFSVRIKGS